MHIALVMNSASGMKILRADFIRFLQSLDHHVIAVCPADASATALRQLGVDVEHWMVTRDGMNPLQDALSILRLRRILVSLQPDAIICFTPKAVLLGSLAARAATGSPLFSVFTGLGFLFGANSVALRALSPLVTILFRYALRLNRVVFFQNPDDRHLFVSKRIVPLARTCRVYGSGVNTRWFTPQVSSRPRAETVFLMIARLIATKGILEFIEAATILKREHCAAHFRLLGAFDDHPTAVDRDAIRSSITSGAIEYCGTTTDVRPYLQDADVFVLPSYYREGTPRSALEAMAMGKPLITTDSPGCRETVIDSRNGYLVPIRDPLSLAAAMRRLIGNHSKIAAMGSVSRRLAEEYYDVDKVNSHMWREMTRSMARIPRATITQPK